MSKVHRIARIRVLREEVEMRRAGLNDDAVATRHAQTARMESLSGRASDELTTQRVARSMELDHDENGQRKGLPTWARRMLRG